MAARGNHKELVIGRKALHPLPMPAVSLRCLALFCMCFQAVLLAGVTIKEIGDVLGHRSTESTAAYLRLATDDLRTVALNMPVGVAP